MAKVTIRLIDKADGKGVTVKVTSDPPFTDDESTNAQQLAVIALEAFKAATQKAVKNLIDGT